MDELDRSFLTYQVERKTEDGSDYQARPMRMFSRNPNDSTKIDYSKGYVQMFKGGENSVAFVQKYEEGMHEKLGVDTIVEVDAPNLSLEYPLVIRKTTQNTSGMTLTGIESVDNKRNHPNRSSESIMLDSGSLVYGALQAGFIPGQRVSTPLGEVIGDRDVRLTIADMRPNPASGIPPVEPVSKV